MNFVFMSHLFELKLQNMSSVSKTHTCIAEFLKMIVSLQASTRICFYAGFDAQRNFAEVEIIAAMLSVQHGVVIISHFN